MRGTARLAGWRAHPQTRFDGTRFYARRYTVKRYSERSMPVPPPDPARFLPLSEPVFQILLALAEEELHGYAIIQAIEEQTRGEVILTASTLYAALRRLLADGLIEERPARSPGDDPRRRYYCLAKTGFQVARLEAERIERAARLARTRRILPPRRG